jgi:hypothetical protein
MTSKKVVNPCWCANYITARDDDSDDSDGDDSDSDSDSDNQQQVSGLLASIVSHVASVSGARQNLLGRCRAVAGTLSGFGGTSASGKTFPPTT